MARLVYSARVLDTLIRQATCVEAAGALSQPASPRLPRVARVFSTCPRQPTAPIHPSHATSDQSSVPDDAYIPLVKDACKDLETHGWPSTTGSPAAGGEQRYDGGIVLDDEAVLGYIHSGLDRSDQADLETDEQRLSRGLETDHAKPLPSQPESVGPLQPQQDAHKLSPRGLSRQVRKARLLREKMAREKLAQQEQEQAMIEEEKEVDDLLRSTASRQQQRLSDEKHNKERRTFEKKPSIKTGKMGTKGTKTISKSSSEDPAHPVEPWKAYKQALDKKFGDQPWNPRKRISPDAIAGVRSLHAQDPELYSMKKLAAYFQISSEAIRRILKSKWTPNEQEAADRRRRWERRGERKWSEMVNQGIRPPRKWREMGVGRVPKGELPAWRKRPPKGGGERWIEHRSPEELFARAAALSARQRALNPAIGDRIL